jgi:hypothetical protein
MEIAFGRVAVQLSGEVNQDLIELERTLTAFYREGEPRNPERLLTIRNKY